MHCRDQGFRPAGCRVVGPADRKVHKLGASDGLFLCFDFARRIIFCFIAIQVMTTQPKPAVSHLERTAHDPALNDARLARIVRVLGHYGMLVVSGTKLAQDIGASRGEVWRLVQQLRALGVDIAGHPATGYHMAAVPDLILPDYVAPLVKGTIFADRIQHFFKTASTNTAGMQAAAGGAAEGSVFLAEEQTAGKGRGGHSWHSAPSTGVYCSVILRPDLSPVDSLVLALASGLAAAAAVEEVSGLKPDLRWPNDLLLARAPSADHAGSGGMRKFCGILTELNAEATRVRYVVVGIGINVNQEEFPPQIEPIATSLRIEGGRKYSRVQLTGALLRALDREYRGLAGGDSGARAAVLRRFEHQSSYARGLEVVVEEEGGYTGITEGLDERGFLRVRSPEGVRTVLHGGVRALNDADSGKV
jgi:BirA family transcriptional regulator, biotin operon repressor / biotin---[acetyl-CoA-carboxylase] ligase